MSNKYWSDKTNRTDNADVTEVNQAFDLLSEDIQGIADNISDIREEVNENSNISNVYSNALKSYQWSNDVDLSDMSPAADEIKLRVHSKNMLPPPASGSTTTAGLTFTANSDGTLTVNGTAETSAAYTLLSASSYYKLPIGKYYFRCFEQRDEAYKNKIYKKLMLRNKSTILKTYTSDRFEVTKEDVEAGYDRTSVSFHLGSNAAGEVFDNAVFHFQIEAGETAPEECTEFVPFGTEVAVYKNGSEAFTATLDSEFDEMTVEAKTGDVFTTDENIAMDVSYPKDINKAFSELEEKLTNAIISLGGEV